MNNDVKLYQKIGKHTWKGFYQFAKMELPVAEILVGLLAGGCGLQGGDNLQPEVVAVYEAPLEHQAKNLSMERKYV